MFNASQGGRMGASKVLLLITDNITDPDTARMETKKLAELGRYTTINARNGQMFTENMNGITKKAEKTMPGL